MYTPKRITYREHGEYALLALDLTDKNGKEYHDGDIVKTSWSFEGGRVPMLGFVRYFAGRFEVVCPFAVKQDAGADRYTLGLNRDHEIIGNMTEDPQPIFEQAKKEVVKP